MPEGEDLAGLRRRLAEAERAVERGPEGEADPAVTDGPDLLQRTVAALRDSERLLRAVFAGALDAIVIADDAGRYLDANDAACALFGLPRDELLGRDVAELAGPGLDVDLTWRAFLEAGHLEGAFTVRGPDGQVREVEYAARANILPGRHLSIMRDVSERRRAEEALRQRERFLDSVFEAAAEAIIVTDEPEGRIVEANPAACALFGLPRQELLGRRAVDFMGLGEEDLKGLRRRLRERGFLSGRGELCRPDGSRRRVTYQARAGFLPRRNLSILRDVTDEQAAHEALLRSEERFALAFQASPGAECIVRERDRVVLDANPRYLELLALDRDQVIGRARGELAGWIDTEQQQEVDRLLAAGESVENVPAEWRTSTGERRDVLVSAVAIDVWGERCRLELIADVTDLRREERARQRAESHLRVVLENAPVLVLTVDRRGIITFIEGRGLSSYGKTASELEGVDLLQRYGDLPVVLQDGAETDLRGVFRRVLAGEQLSGTLSIDDVHYQEWWIPQRQDGQVVGMVVAALDVTDQARLERQVRESQKLEAIGRLAGGVAHDFNNMLMAISGFALLVRDGLPKGSPLRGHVEQILRASERTTRLTRQLLAFSRRQVLLPELVDVGRLVQDAAQLLRHLIGEHIELRTEVPSRSPQVYADAAQLEQVLVNLVVNARDAMPEGGALTVRVAAEEVEASQAAALDLAAGPYVTVTVSDTGAGMDAATAARVFEPFFTTKEPGQGTGLGLATAYGIVRQSGGQVTVDSAPGAGTTFTLHLPHACCAAHLEQPSPGRAPAPRTASHARVLVVEDEPLVRQLVVEVLEGAGHTVLQAEHAAQALALCEDPANAIDLLVTDVVMPGSSGLLLAERARALRPALRVLFMSGYLEGLESPLAAMGDAFLEKPFRPARLLEAVRDAVEA